MFWHDNRTHFLVFAQCVKADIKTIAIMIQNYITIAFRNIWKNKLFSAITIVGLSIGISASFAIGILIFHDLSFDNFHKEGDLIYRVTTDFSTPDGGFHNRGVAVPLGKALQEDVPGITVATFFSANFQSVENRTSGYKHSEISDALYTDGSYFGLFHYNWLSGSSSNVFSNPNEVVLAKSRASLYFPELSPQQMVGKTLIYNDSIPVKVVGVVEDLKQRTDFTFKEFLSVGTAARTRMSDMVLSDQWNNTNSGSQLFIKLTQHAQLPGIQNHLDALAKEHSSPELIAFGQQRSFSLQPLDDLHFNTNYGIFNHNGPPVNKNVLLSLVVTALFLLLLGCINFINLSTANAVKRSREIGVRKTIGGSKKQLIFQFLGETFVLTLLAGGLSLVLTYGALNVFRDFIPKTLDFQLLGTPEFLMFMAVLLLLVSLLSGFYPAVVLSRFKPVTVLKNQYATGLDRSLLRKYLTIFQFVIAQVFIIATFLVARQINYMMSRDMGIKIEANAFLNAWQDDNFDKRLRIVEQLKILPQVSEVSLGGNPPASSSVNSSILIFRENDKEVQTNVELLFGDLSYRKLYDIKLLAGRSRRNDTIKEYVINETYSRILGFATPEAALGKNLVVGEDTYPIVGVMEDFNQRSLHSTIKPLALTGDINRNGFSQFNIIHFSLQATPTEQWPQTIGEIEKLWGSTYPELRFDISFMDELVAQFYEQERRTSFLLKWATGFAIIISCLGLLGLVIHTTERRTKEIGIRKVLGASLSQLQLLLCREFLLLVGIAFILASPIAYWGLQRWLEGFAYRVNLSWWVFGASGFLMCSIALLTMGIRTLAVARINPVKSLRTE